MVYVCMYDHRFQQSMDQPGKVANPARGQLNRKNIFFLVPIRALKFVSTGSAVPSRVSLLILHTQPESRTSSRDSSRFPRRHPFIYLNRHTSSGQSRVYRVTQNNNKTKQLRTDGAHCRESAGTGPVNLKVVPNGCCLGRSRWTK